MDSPLIVIVGAGNGIGRACAEEYLRHGGRVLAVDVDGDALQSLGDEAARNEGRLLVSTADARRQEDMDAVAALARADGGISALVYTAGVLRVADAGEADETVFREIFESNVMGAVLAVRALLSSFGSGGGSILLLSSVAARLGFPGLSLYSGSKAALEGVMRGLAVELAPRNIRVNALAPTMVETAMAESELRVREQRGEGTVESMRRDFAAAQPIPRFAETAEVAHLCRMLSGDTMGLMTGSVIVYDGGLSVRG